MYHLNRSNLSPTKSGVLHTLKKKNTRKARQNQLSSPKTTHVYENKTNRVGNLVMLNPLELKNGGKVEKAKRLISKVITFSSLATDISLIFSHLTQ